MTHRTRGAPYWCYIQAFVCDVDFSSPACYQRAGLRRHLPYLMAKRNSIWAERVRWETSYHKGNLHAKLSMRLKHQRDSWQVDNGPYCGLCLDDDDEKRCQSLIWRTADISKILSLWRVTPTKRFIVVNRYYNAEGPSTSISGQNAVKTHNGYRVYTDFSNYTDPSSVYWRELWSNHQCHWGENRSKRQITTTVPEISLSRHKQNRD